jgi:hypothetical protein
MMFEMNLARTGERILHGVVRAVALWMGALGLAGTASAQDVLWDHIGNGVRAPEPERFEVIGDLTGDGLPEIIWSSDVMAQILPSEGGNAIKSHIYQEFNWGFSSNYPNGLCNVGDLDGDGIEEYTISAAGFSTATSHWAGKVFVYSGATLQVISSIYLGNQSEFFGAFVLSLGDINADGDEDFGIVAGDCLLRVYHGPNWTYVREHCSPVRSPVGDLNGDGYDDYALGDGGYGPWAGGDFIGQGKADVISGIDGSVLLTVVGTTAYELLGGVTGPAGDWNGDGIVDLVVGAGGYEDFGPEGLYVFDGSDGSILHYFGGAHYATRASYFAHSAHSGHDVNGDGVPDLILGAPRHPWRQFIGQYPDTVVRGSAFVFSGATGSLLWEMQGDHKGQRLGGKVQFIDDFNSDGFADFVVMSSNYDLTPGVLNDGPHAGRLTVYAGASGDAVPVCAAGPNSTGSSARLWNTGPISVEQNRFELALSDLPPSHLAIVVHGQLTPPHPFGAGELCLGTPLSVLGMLVSPGNGNFVRLPVDLESSPFTDGGNVLLAGNRWAFQALYRDQGVRNTSNALDVTFVP